MDILRPLYKFKLIVVILVFLHAGTLNAQESIMVVVNYPNKDLKLSTSAIRNLFMGSPLDIELIPVNLPSGNINRIHFNTRVIGLTESRIQSYWAQMRFSGRKKAPIELGSEAEVIQYVSKTPGAIAYLPENANLPQNLQILVIVK